MADISSETPPILNRHSTDTTKCQLINCFKVSANTTYCSNHDPRKLPYSCDNCSVKADGRNFKFQFTSSLLILLLLSHKTLSCSRCEMFSILEILLSYNSSFFNWLQPLRPEMVCGTNIVMNK